MVFSVHRFNFHGKTLFFLPRVRLGLVLVLRKDISVNYQRTYIFIRSNTSRTITIGIIDTVRRVNSGQKLLCSSVGICHKHIAHDGITYPVSAWFMIKTADQHFGCVCQ